MGVPEGHSVGKTGHSLSLSASLRQVSSPTCLSFVTVPEGLGTAGGQYPVTSDIKRESYRDLSLSVDPKDQVKPVQMGHLSHKKRFVFALWKEPQANTLHIF